MRVAILATLLSSFALAAGVDSFSPQGAVRDVRQAKALFSDSMVKFGDPRVADPFDVQCGEEKGTGRWIDDKTWVYDFVRDVPAAVACKFVLKGGLKTLKGDLLPATNFVFTTGGPEPGGPNNQIWPSTGERIGENQIFMLAFGAPPTQQSLLAKTRCEVEGLRERLPVTVLSAVERDKLFTAYFGKYRQNWPANAEALRCQRPLPADAKVELVFDAGLAAANGLTTREPMRFEYRVRPKFTAWVSCERSREKSACIPISPIELRFSDDVDASVAKQAVLMSADGKQKWAADVTISDDDNTIEDENGKRAQMVSSVRFKPLFPESAALRVVLPAGLRDQYGRLVSNANQFPQAVKVDTFPSLAKFSAEFGIVERSIGVLPVTVRNVGELAKADAGLLDKLTDLAKSAVGAAGAATPGLPYRQLNVTSDADIIRWYQKLKHGADSTNGQDGRSASLLKGESAAQRLRLPSPNDDKAAEVIGVPLPKTGLTIVEIESTRLGQRLLEPVAPMQVAAGALVTNLGVHLRRGLDDALVWVTTLDKGWLVNAANITVLDCKGKLIASGKTDKQGVWQYNKTLPTDRYDCPLFVFARAGDDVSFVLSNWDQGIESWRFGISTERDRNERRAYHAVFDRGLYRAGETVSMKLFGREMTGAGFGLLADSKLPNQVRLRHMGSDDSVVLPLKWSAGAAEQTWKVPAEAKLGSYAVQLERKQGKDIAGLGEAGVFNVAEFRVPLMRGVLKLPVNPVASNKLDVVAQVQYLAGGPAAGEKVSVRALVSPLGGRSLEDFEGFNFSEGNVSKSVLRGVENEEGDGEGEDAPLESKDAVLDKAGGATLSLSGWKALDGPANVHAELEYRDPNGEVQTSASSTIIWPAAVQAGLRTGGRKAGANGTTFDLAVASLTGKPLANRAVKAEGWLRQTFSHRKRLVGGFYSYEHSTRYQALGELCAGKTNAKGTVACVLPSKIKGEVIVRVVAKDDQGRESFTRGELSTRDGGDWDAASDSDRIDLIADKKSYEPGETANIRVQMPFREGTALIAVEREQVLEWRTQVLTAANSIVKIPLKSNYGPNVFVSVLVVRGRVADPAETALVDLAKPAYKLGITNLTVGTKGYALDVKVAADKAVYQTRDKATVKVVVKSVDGKPLAKGAEVAIAAVDEGLLALRNNESWKLLDAMLGARPYGFFTATAQGQVIGKRHFGRKAVPVGGGGGRGGTRELFETLLLWKGRVALDAKGEATVEVPLNDSLTSFRIVAVANAGSDHFGTGETNIRATKDVMLFAGLARTVRQGDRFDAGFTLRNTTQQPISMVVNAKIDGQAALVPQNVDLAGGEARELVWPITVPAEATQLRWTVEAIGSNGKVLDKFAQKQAVIEAIPVRVMQATLAQIPPDYNLPVAKPADALTGRGGIYLKFSPSLVAALGGVEDYMRAYPYTCLEQQTSRAMSLNDEAGWRSIVGRLDSYLDSDGFAKYWPNLELGSPILTAHLLTLSAQSGWVLPEDGKARLKTALTGYVEGRLQPDTRTTSDSTRRAIRQLDAIAALALNDAARPNMLDGLVIEPNRWPTSTLLDWINVLEKLTDAPKRAERLKEARQILNARMDLSGTTLNFSSGSSGDGWWWMDSPDGDAARILMDAMSSNDRKTDLGRIARGVVARQQHGHWDTTVANAWGALALRRFAEKVEAGQPTGTTVAKLGSEQQVDWAKLPKGGDLKLPWPDQSTNLTLTHQGAGKPWAVIESRAAIPLKAPFASGYRVSKEWTPVEAKGKGFARGDVWRVKITFDAQADMTWVAVNDPIPAGATILGRGFGTESTLLTRKEASGAWPVFDERGETSYRAYFDWLPKGTYTVEYTVRLNTRGSYALPPTRIEALYAPERFGEFPNPTIKVE